MLSNPDAFEAVVDALAGLSRALGATHVVGIESRGFILGTPVSLALGLPFVPVRKPGKLPAETLRHEYELEYGTDALEIHTDALGQGGDSSGHHRRPFGNGGDCLCRRISG